MGFTLYEWEIICLKQNLQIKRGIAIDNFTRMVSFFRDTSKIARRPDSRKRIKNTDLIQFWLKRDRRNSTLHYYLNEK